MSFKSESLLLLQVFKWFMLVCENENALVSTHPVRTTILLESFGEEYTFPLIAMQLEKLEVLDYGRRLFITSNCIGMNLMSIITSGQMLNLFLT